MHKQTHWPHFPLDLCNIHIMNVNYAKFQIKSVIVEQFQGNCLKFACVLNIPVTWYIRNKILALFPRKVFVFYNEDVT